MQQYKRTFPPCTIVAVGGRVWKESKLSKKSLERRLAWKAAHSPLSSWYALAIAVKSSTTEDMESILEAALSAESWVLEDAQPFLGALLAHRVANSQQAYLSLLQRVNERCDGVLFGYAIDYFASVRPCLTPLSGFLFESVQRGSRFAHTAGHSQPRTLPYPHFNTNN